jgi:rhamnosyltransferase
VQANRRKKRLEVTLNSNSTPRIAVLLAAYNGVRFIEEQVESILVQKEVDVKIFVSVDSSTDGTEGWVDARAKLDPRIVPLPHGNRFGSAARNFFRLIRDVDFQEFDYVAFADQDDIWLPEKLLRAHTLLVESDAVAYSSNVIAFWPSGKRVLVEKAQPQRRWDFLFEAAGPGCTYLMKTAFMLEVKRVVADNWNAIQQVGLHDWFSYAYARAHGLRWIIDEYAGLLYRQHQENEVGVNSGWKAFRHRARKVLGGWGLSQAALIARLTGLGDDAFVRQWNSGKRSSLLWLAFHAGQCRRRARDKVLFALSCLALSISGSRMQ